MPHLLELGWPALLGARAAGKGAVGLAVSVQREVVGSLHMLPDTLQVEHQLRVTHLAPAPQKTF